MSCEGCEAYSDTKWCYKFSKLARNIEYSECKRKFVDSPEKTGTMARKELSYFEGNCKDIAESIADIVIKKQRDYGKSNIEEFGEQGILVRSNDKFARLKNLILNNKNPANESIEDTWTDIAGYAILALMLRKGVFGLPLEAEK